MSIPPLQPGLAGSPVVAIILLVEDHRDTAAAMFRLLTHWGYAVMVAHDLGEAVRIAGEHRFDLLISDCDLPDGCGLDLRQRLPPGRGWRAISVTAFSQVNERSRAAGFDAHMTKPVHPGELAQVIQSLLRQQGSVGRA